MTNEWKSKISAIFAEQGDVVNIPVEAQGDNQVSFATGYTKNYNKDAKDDLGNPLVKFGIERTKFNYLLKIITSAIKELQETLPVYTTDTDKQKVDVGAIIENTTAFSALTDLLCIDDTGKASKITKEELITQLNPNINLSNSNISVTEIADTALNNFLAIDSTIIKKANKLLQEVIKEIDLSADNVKVTKETTYTDNHKILVVNSAGATHKVNKLLQSVIDEINLSADNINVKHINTGTTTLKPLMVDENGKITSEDSISSNLVKGNILAKGFKTIVMTKEQYPNGIDGLTETGLYSLASMDEYKDIVNDSLPSERKEYIKKVLGQILTLFNYSNEQTANLDITKFSDLIYCPTHQIQVVGVSQGETDNTTIQQTFILFGIMLGTRIGTMALDTVEFNNIVKMNGLPYIPISVEQANNVKGLALKIISEDSPITSYNEITESGYYIILKQLTESPLEITDDNTTEVGLLQVINTNDKAYSSIGIKNIIQIQYLLPTHKTVTDYNYLNVIASIVPIQYPVFKYRLGMPLSSDSEGELTFIDWIKVDSINGILDNIDLSANNITVSKQDVNTATNTFLMTELDNTVVKVEKNNIINSIISEVNAGIDLTNYYTKTETDDKLNKKFDKNTDKLDLSSKVENILDTTHGGTDTNDGYGWKNIYETSSIKKVLGITEQSMTMAQFLRKVISKNNSSSFFGCLLNKEFITDLPDVNGNQCIIFVRDANQASVIVYTPYDFETWEFHWSNYTGTWKKTRNADGTIPDDLIPNIDLPTKTTGILPYTKGGLGRNDGLSRGVKNNVIRNGNNWQTDNTQGLDVFYWKTANSAKLGLPTTAGVMISNVFTDDLKSFLALNLSPSFPELRIKSYNSAWKMLAFNDDVVNKMPKAVLSSGVGQFKSVVGQGVPVSYRLPNDGTYLYFFTCTYDYNNYSAVDNKAGIAEGGSEIISTAMNYKTFGGFIWRIQ